jgi:hypothetical protein
MILPGKDATPEHTVEDSSRQEQILERAQRPCPQRLGCAFQIGPRRRDHQVAGVG